jgi:hypothetical protein
VRILAHIKKLDECFGQFLVRIIRDCRLEIEPEALARLLAWSVTLKERALRMRCCRFLTTAKKCPSRNTPAAMNDDTISSM